MLEVADVVIGIPKSRGSISFDLQPGEVHAIMAESGAGKTGLAHILAGLEQPIRGNIYLNRQPVLIKDPFHAILLGIGVFFNDTSYSLIPHLTIKEYLFLWHDGHIISNKRLAEKAKGLLDEYEVNINADTLIFELSQEQRCLIYLMKLLARRPSILILDEPSVDLSETGKQHLFRILQKCRSSSGILYLSNQLEEILQVADRVTILKEGATVASFPIEVARKNPGQVLAVYFGHGEQYSEQENEFKGIIDTLMQTTELLTSEYELHDLLNLLVQKIAEATKADVCAIYLFNEISKKTVEHFRFVRPGSPEAVLNEELISAVITTGDALVAGDLSETDVLRFFGGVYPVKSIMCMPIYLHARASGAIEISYMNKRLIAHEDIDLLKMFATQVAIAIENTRLLGRSTLLKEAHHRIKNNLQSIVSLLLLQIQSNSTKSLETIIWEIIDRIKTIASVHETLSQDERSIGLINVKTIIAIIISNHKERINQDKIRILFDLDDLYVSYKIATSLGLIVNELLSNCLEHAFPNEHDGLIQIDLHHDHEHVKLQVTDDGVGFADVSTDQGSNSLGLSLVKTLVNRELRGTIAMESRQGARLSIVFPKQSINS